MDLEAEISFHEQSSMHADFPDTPQPEPGGAEPQAAAGLPPGVSGELSACICVASPHQQRRWPVPLP